MKKITKKRQRIKKEVRSGMSSLGKSAVIVRYCPLCNKDTLQELTRSGEYKCVSCRTEGV